MAVSTVLLSSSPYEQTPALAAITAARPRVPTGKAVTIAFGGDVHFTGSSRQALSGGLAPITPVLAGADIAVVNLETAVTDRGSPAAKQYVFRAPANAFTALRSAGVDVVTMANNHGMDYGVQGLRDSLAAARGLGVATVGIGLDATQAFAPYRTRVNGQRIAVIGATQVLDTWLAAAWSAGPGKPGLASAQDDERLLRVVRAARATSDTVVVDLHWGQERVGCPTAPQRSLAARVVAAGADVVVGSHAHVLLGAGYLDGAYVDYGLGNFVFYATSDPATRSGVLTLTVRGRAVTASTWTPATIWRGVPVPLTGSAARTATTAWRRLRGCTGLSATQAAS